MGPGDEDEFVGVREEVVGYGEADSCGEERLGVFFLRRFEKFWMMGCLGFGEGCVARA